MSSTRKRWMGIVDGKTVQVEKVYKVYTKDEYGFEDYMYCYSKECALAKRAYWQELGCVKVMIKGRR
jgi:hypothetical protein